MPQAPKSFGHFEAWVFARDTSHTSLTISMLGRAHPTIGAFLCIVDFRPEPSRAIPPQTGRRTSSQEFLRDN